MTTLLLLTLLNVQSTEWYDKTTRATLSANQQMNDAGKKALASWRQLESRKGSIKTRKALLELIRDARSIVRTLQSRHGRAKTAHEQSKRYLRNSLYADEIERGGKLHKLMEDRIAKMSARFAEGAGIIKALEAEITKFEKAARESNPASKGHLDKALAEYRKARETVTSAAKQASGLMQKMRESQGKVNDAAGFGVLAKQMNGMLDGLQAALNIAKQANQKSRKHLADGVFSGEVENNGSVHRTFLPKLNSQTNELNKLEAGLRRARVEIANLVKTAKKLQVENANANYKKIYSMYTEVETEGRALRARLVKAVSDAGTVRNRRSSDPLVVRLKKEQVEIAAGAAGLIGKNTKARQLLQKIRAAKEIQPEAAVSLSNLLGQQADRVRRLTVDADKLKTAFGTGEGPKPSAAKPSVADLIKKHTTGPNLNEEALAEDLLKQLPDNAEFVSDVLKALNYTNRDDVAEAVLGLASEDQLDRLKDSPTGKKMLALMVAELADGWDTSGERKQSERVFDAVDTDAPKGTYSEGKQNQWEALKEGKWKAADGLIGKHTNMVGDLKEDQIAIELLGKMRYDPVLVQSVLDRLGSTDRDDVSLAMMSAATDNQIKALAGTPRGREAVLRLAEEMFHGSKSGSEKLEMQRVMALVTEVDRAAGKTPKVEVLTLMYGGKVLDGAGQVVGSQGHTAIVVGDMVYSYELGWRTGMTKSQYLRENSWRDVISQTLKLPQGDVNKIQDALNDHAGKGVYAVGGDICTDSAGNLLNRSLRNLPQTWSPPRFVGMLERTGKVESYRFYPKDRYED